MNMLNFTKLSKIDTKKYIDYILFILIIYVLIRYSLDFKVIYPEIILELNEQYIFKILLYLSLFIIANYNITYGILYFIFLVFLEFDNILFMK
jgi:hypothetical protein